MQNSAGTLENILEKHENNASHACGLLQIGITHLQRLDDQCKINNYSKKCNNDCEICPLEQEQKNWLDFFFDDILNLSCEVNCNGG